jgi:hypothetical protein
MFFVIFSASLYHAARYRYIKLAALLRGAKRQHAENPGLILCRILPGGVIRRKIRHSGDELPRSPFYDKYG